MTDFFLVCSSFLFALYISVGFSSKKIRMDIDGLEHISSRFQSRGRPWPLYPPREPPLVHGERTICPNQSGNDSTLCKRRHWTRPPADKTNVEKSPSDFPGRGRKFIAAVLRHVHRRFVAVFRVTHFRGQPMSLPNTTNGGRVRLN